MEPRRLVSFLTASLTPLVLLSSLRVLVAGAYKSLWDTLWYGVWLPGPIGLILFILSPLVVRNTLTVSLPLAAYGILLGILPGHVVLLHLIAGLAATASLWIIAWSRSSGLTAPVLLGLGLDLALRVYTAGAVVEEDPAASRIVAVAAIALALVVAKNGYISRPGFTDYAAATGLELGLAYPNFMLRFSSIHGYGLGEYAAASAAVLAAAWILTGYGRARSAAAALVALAGALTIQYNTPFTRLLGILFIASASWATFWLGLWTRRGYLLGPTMLTLFAFMAVAVYAYPYLGAWLLADKYEYVLALLAALYAAMLVPGQAHLPLKPTRRPHPAYLVLTLALVAASLVVAHLAYGSDITRPISQQNFVEIVTYNVHQGFTPDGRLNGLAVTEFVKCSTIICLQEVDGGRLTSAYLDLPLLLRARKHLYVVFMPAIEETYGVAIASQHPIVWAKGLSLTSLGEQRVAIKASILVGGEEVTVVNAHLGLDSRERVIQARELIGFANEEPKALIVCGDFNEEHGKALDIIKRFYRLIPIGEPTCCIGEELKRIDYIGVLVGLDASIERYVVVWTLTASDHFPVVAWLRVTRP